MMRVILKYSRLGVVRFLSHLDMQRLFARALRRSGLPVAFSAGFNPHIIMSFASPLSVGYETLGDYLEIKLTEEVCAEKILEDLNAVMPCGVKIVFASMLEEKTKKLMSLNSSAEYEIVFEHDVEKEFCDFMQKESVIAKDRKGREMDVRSYVLYGNAEKNKIFVKLKNSSEQAMNPATIAALFAKEEEKISYLRIECYAKTNDGEIPFCKIVNVAG